MIMMVCGFLNTIILIIRMFPFKKTLLSKGGLVSLIIGIL